VNAFCDIPGYAGGRNLSFLPVGRSSLALSISMGSQVAWALAQDNKKARATSVPAYPAFVAFDAALMANAPGAPHQLRPLLELLTGSDQIVLGLVPDGTSLRLAFDAECQSPAKAEALKRNVDHLITAAGGLGEFLPGGTVRLEGAQVHGRWPIERQILETLFIR
jgi:hypothetical protein